MNVRQALANLQRFPWAAAGTTLVERFREDRLGLTASSLTFTTTIALVPFFTVVLAVFTAFPMFGKLQGALQTWLVQSLIPDSIARQVLGYLTQFAGKASRLGAFGLAALFVTAIALVLTIDRTLNGIWRVKRPRPLGQRVLIYWAVMTLGPLLLSASLSVSSYLLSASKGLVAGVPGAVQLVFNFLEFVLLAAGFTALYRFVPNTAVRREHAMAGGLFAAVGIEVARRVLAWYLGKVPTYSLVYGAFATLPILLVWIYIAWLVVLWGAVIAAYLPSLTGSARRRARVPGWQFQLALEALKSLRALRDTPRHGMNTAQLADALGVDTLQLESVMETLVALDWVGRVNEAQDEGLARYVLLADPAATPLEPLVRRLLVQRVEVTDGFFKAGNLATLRLADAL